MLHLILFSPTGGTKKAVDFLAEAWDGEKRELDLSVFGGDYAANSFQEEDLCIIGVPSFGGRVPTVALERLLQLRGNNTPAVLVVSFGNRAFDDTLLELKTALTQRGFHCIAAVAAVTEHSMVRRFGEGRPNGEDAKVLRSFGAQIRGALAQGGPLPSVDVPGKAPYRAFPGSPIKPKADRSCTRCGVCAKQCPVGAILAERPRETLKDRCITCMRCVSVCPNGARKLNPVLLLALTQKLEKSCGTPKENVLFLR